MKNTLPFSKSLSVLLLLFLAGTSSLFGQAEIQNPSFPFWKINGNSGTIDGTHFIGTTDNIPFNIRVNNQMAGRVDKTKRNIFFGYNAGVSNTTGTDNVFLGDSVARSSTTASHLVGIGSHALFSNTGTTDAI